MPQMYFMTNVKKTSSSSVKSVMPIITSQSQPQHFSFSPVNSNVNNSSNLRDMFNAIRTGSTSCKACGRG